MEVINEFDKIMQDVKTSMAVENHNLTKQDISFIKNYDEGKYTMEEAIKLVIDGAIKKGEEDV